jgi:hypothetical protein
MQATRRSTQRWLPTAAACGKVAPMLAALQWFLAAEDAATEGKKVITGMLITGLIFIGVIALGETSRWLRHRRR